ncbi:MAG TPA: acetylornithine transaminase [Terriglobia bacterium]|nr:acetylornithine transaminase [Terriglobia bacterium]
MQARDSLMFITHRPDITFVRGEGSWLYDAEGNAYLDFVQGWAVNSLGHSPRIVREALAAQSERVINVSPAYYNEPMRRLAGLLASLSGLDRVFFANSGAEANEGAIKLARKWGSVKRGGASQIVVFEDAFHGRTLATMSASGKPQWRDLYEPKVSGFVRVPRNDLSAARRAIGPSTAAVMLEPIQGEAGVVPFSIGFLQGLRELTSELDVLLILDEIQTGIGRTGRMFYFEHAGIRPDVMTLGKGIGAGVPLAALLAREDVCLFEAGDQGGTFNGNPLMTAVGHAVVQEISRPGFLAEVQRNGDYLAAQLRELSQELGLGEVRGQGLLLALELKREAASKVVEASLARRLLINSPRPTALRFMPALNVTKDELDRMLGILREAIRSVP